MRDRGIGTIKGLIRRQSMSLLVRVGVNRSVLERRLCEGARFRISSGPRPLVWHIRRMTARREHPCINHDDDRTHVLSSGDKGEESQPHECARA